jgi:hypothetical protein
MIPSVDRRFSHPAAEWRYYFPENQRSAVDSEMLKHRMLTKLCGHIILSPAHSSFDASTGIVDMGTGTGDWAIHGTFLLSSVGDSASS